MYCTNTWMKQTDKNAVYTMLKEFAYHMLVLEKFLISIFN